MIKKRVAKSKKPMCSNKKHKTTKRKYVKIVGGDINKGNIFERIKSIGFEIETTELIKFTIEKNEGKEILVNSSLTNVDLEYGYFDENEFTYIVNKPNELEFKITNDSAEDSAFNEALESHFQNHKNDDDDCPDVVFQLVIPQNKY
jgi:hypothetical protein